MDAGAYWCCGTAQSITLLRYVDIYFAGISSLVNSALGGKVEHSAVRCDGGRRDHDGTMPCFWWILAACLDAM